MKNIIVIVFFTLVSTCSFARELNLEAKMKEIDRYYAVQSPEEMLNSFVESYSANLDKEEAEIFRELMLNEIKFDQVIEGVKPIMAKHFTLDELKALADFFESEHGRSSMDKMGPYMAEFMPVLQSELKRALEVWKARRRSKLQP